MFFFLQTIFQVLLKVVCFLKKFLKKNFDCARSSLQHMDFSLVVVQGLRIVICGLLLWSMGSRVLGLSSCSTWTLQWH